MRWRRSSSTVGSTLPVPLPTSRELHPTMLTSPTEPLPTAASLATFPPTSPSNRSIASSEKDTVELHSLDENTVAPDENTMLPSPTKPLPTAESLATFPPTSPSNHSIASSYEATVSPDDLDKNTVAPDHDKIHVNKRKRKESGKITVATCTPGCTLRGNATSHML